MPKRKRTRTQNLPKKTRRAQDHDGPGQMQIRLAIQNPEGSSESPEITELTALEHFSSVLQRAQRTMEEGGKCAQALCYTGKSERTQRRQKKALRDLQAKGFQTLPDFFRKKAEETEAKTKLEAMLVSEPDMSWGSAPRDTPERRTPATQHSKGATSEPRRAEGISRDPRLGHPWVAESDTCSDSDSPQYAVEEVEEDSDDSDETGSNPSVGEQDSREDPRAIVALMLEDLRNRNVPDVGGHLHSTGSVLDILQDRVALRTAKVELVAILKEKKSDDFVRSRILAMEALLNVYLDTDLDCGWTDASILVAKTQGRGTTRAAQSENGC
ncbi:hypothetical protein EDB85DRAFT_1890393 [Lactarius pseudohatsudake]|nr:hypothetical protein EDB85DRAFT_1902834 [Lactarius pseudohatsudake]KAH9018437.1 hypothetical protein EDB85DRAFT_1897184 [Lactarius pseudohatsudake]KAH9033118.1 hypothetical protein EDB85DRAFT_1890393 [Lactarius pseudohatsudake]